MLSNPNRPALLPPFRNRSCIAESCFRSPLCCGGSLSHRYACNRSEDVAAPPTGSITHPISVAGAAGCFAARGNGLRLVVPRSTFVPPTHARPHDQDQCGANEEKVQAQCNCTPTPVRASGTSANGLSGLPSDHLLQCRSEVTALRAQLDGFCTQIRALFRDGRYTARRRHHGEAQCRQPGRVRVLLVRSCPKRCSGNQVALKTVTCA
jgi:hypothetical protein